MVEPSKRSLAIWVAREGVATPADIAAATMGPHEMIMMMLFIGWRSSAAEIIRCEHRIGPRLDDGPAARRSPTRHAIQRGRMRAARASEAAHASDAAGSRASLAAGGAAVGAVVRALVRMTFLRPGRRAPPLRASPAATPDAMRPAFERPGVEPGLATAIMDGRAPEIRVARALRRPFSLTFAPMCANRPPDAPSGRATTGPRGE
ncbi:hypothetical protein P2H44_04900 [Albimonas sp. CAU 1670]|uniref:hypothetical protein n=1 Tax=Albimonas sp. CAU 1670 TaxID=3032599 RepID=UPI0023DCB78C|nr:hypothetical protein [Albimonas sp. CAU 1670]MDF2231884.1 hypothetical protein [Albimonas sp. CAU 1670]